MLTPTMPVPAARLLSALDALAEVDASTLTGQEQAEMLRAVGRAEAKLFAIKTRLLSAVDKAGTPRASGAADTGQWAAKLTNSDEVMTRRAVAVASGLSERRATATALSEGTLSPEHAAVIVQATRQLPPTVTEAQVGDATVRTDWDHARGLALCELIEHLPTDHLHTKTAATIVVTLDEEQMRDRLKAARLDTGEVISAGEARRLACNAGIIPAVLSGGSMVLDLGRLKRLFSEAQRIALGLVHQSCAAEGCQRPFAWCELHHRDPWSTGGRTDLQEAVPLCHFHHQRIHDAAFVHVFLADGRVRFRARR